MQYRGCSAIYLFSGKSAMLMDCAEGTYGQIVDYCIEQKKVDEVVLKTKVIYITHLHGDHNLGLPNFLEERDKVLDKLPLNQRTKLFVLLPDCMVEWISHHAERLKHPDMVCVMPHHIFNPEKYYFYKQSGYNRCTQL